jgi:hypothetical protein
MKHWSTRRKTLPLPIFTHRFHKDCPGTPFLPPWNVSNLKEYLSWAIRFQLYLILLTFVMAYAADKCPLASQVIQNQIRRNVGVKYITVSIILNYSYVNRYQCFRQTSSSLSWVYNSPFEYKLVTLGPTWNLWRILMSSFLVTDWLRTEDSIIRAYAYFDVRNRVLGIPEAKCQANKIIRVPWTNKIFEWNVEFRYSKRYQFPGSLKSLSVDDSYVFL